MEKPELFEKRKQDHIRLALDLRSEAVGFSGLEKIALVHEALPDLDFSEIQIGKELWGHRYEAPLFVSSMTAGHADSLRINSKIVEVATAKNWLVGVGSQRRELDDVSAAAEWQSIRRAAPQAKLMANLGIAQLIQNKNSEIHKLVDSLGAVAMIIHLNALQETIQLEGTPQFRGGYDAIRRLCSELEIPVIVKEVGCGMSKLTLQRLRDCGVSAIDLGGFGGTHWGRVEGLRAEENSMSAQVAQTFADWGISTLDSVMNAREVLKKLPFWASGGVRTGLDAAKLIAMGAQMVGFAKPMMQAVLKSEAELAFTMERMELELKTAMFCTGCRDLKDLSERGVWEWKK